MDIKLASNVDFDVVTEEARGHVSFETGNSTEFIVEVGFVGERLLRAPIKTPDTFEPIYTVNIDSFETQYDNTSSEDEEEEVKHLQEIEEMRQQAKAQHQKAEKNEENAVLKKHNEELSILVKNLQAEKKILQTKLAKTIKEKNRLIALLAETTEYKNSTGIITNPVTTTVTVHPSSSQSSNISKAISHSSSSSTNTRPTAPMALSLAPIYSNTPVPQKTSPPSMGERAENIWIVRNDRYLNSNLYCSLMLLHLMKEVPWESSLFVLGKAMAVMRKHNSLLSSSDEIEFLEAKFSTSTADRILVGLTEMMKSCAVLESRITPKNRYEFYYCSICEKTEKREGGRTLPYLDLSQVHSGLSIQDKLLDSMVTEIREPFNCSCIFSEKTKLMYQHCSYNFESYPDNMVIIVKSLLKREHINYYLRTGDNKFYLRAVVTSTSIVKVNNPKSWQEVTYTGFVSECKELKLQVVALLYTKE